MKLNFKRNFYETSHSLSLNKELRRRHLGCEIDHSSQLHHDCLIIEEEKNGFNTMTMHRLWSAIKREILAKVNVYLNYFFKYLPYLLEVDAASSTFLYYINRKK